MGKWNEQAAPNNNLKATTIGTSNLVEKGVAASKINNETGLFAEGKENQIIKNQLK